MQKVEKSQKLVTPKKIRKMYIQAVQTSFENRFSEESKKQLFRFRVALILLSVYGFIITYTVIYLGYRLAKMLEI